jgi:hypothetical protein
VPKLVFGCERSEAVLARGESASDDLIIYIEDMSGALTWQSETTRISHNQG